MKFINQIFYKKKVENKGKNFFLTNRNENDLKNLMFATSDSLIGLNILCTCTRPSVLSPGTNFLIGKSFP